MKLIYLHQYFKTPEMEGSIRSYQISKYFVSKGIDITIITCSNNHQKVTTESIDGIKVIWLPIPYSNNFSFYRRLYFFCKYIIMCILVAHKQKFTHLYASSTPLTVGIPALYLSYLKSTPMIFEVRDLWPHVPISMGIIKNRVIIYLSQFLEKLIYDYSSLIVTLSPDMSKFIINKNKTYQKKVITVSNACDFELFKVNEPLKALDAKKLPKKFLLYAGTFGRVNDCSYIVKLADHFRHLNSEIKFVLVGGGIEFDYIYKLSNTKKLINQDIFLFNQISKNEITSLIKLSCGMISTVANIEALNANSANKIFDGLAAGKPIIINHGGWIKNMIEDNNLGIALNQDFQLSAKRLNDFLLENDDNQRSHIINFAKANFDRQKLNEYLYQTISKINS